MLRKLSLTEGLMMYLAMQYDNLYLRNSTEREGGLRGRAVPIADVQAIRASPDLITFIVGVRVYSYETNSAKFLDMLEQYGHRFDRDPNNELFFHPA